MVHEKIVLSFNPFLFGKSTHQFYGKFFFLLFVLGDEEDMESLECLPSASWTCPTPCKCSDGIADCRNKKLTHIPSHFPADTTEM